MPKRLFHLPENVDVPIVVEWSGSWKTVSVRVADEMVLAFENKKSLKKGDHVQLPNGQSLHVGLKSNFISGESLYVEIDGQPALGSEGDPEAQIKGAMGILFFLAAINIILGLLAVFGNIQIFIELGMGWESIIMGMFYGIMGVLAKMKSRVAIGLAMFIFLADSIGGMVLSQNFAIGGIIIRVAIVAALAKGLKGAIDYHKSLTNN